MNEDLSTMNLTESDLDCLPSTARWEVDLPAENLDELLGSIGDPISHETRAAFERAIMGLVARYVESANRRPLPFRPGCQSPTQTNPRCRATRRGRTKPTTQVRVDLGRILRTARHAASLAQNLSPGSKSAILGYLRQSGWLGRTHICRGPTFPQTWDSAHNALMLIQVACERQDPSSPILIGSNRKELARLSAALDTLIIAIESAVPLTRRILTRAHRRRAAEWPKVATQVTEDPVQDLLGWLTLIESIASHPKIEVKRGPDDAHLRTLVQDLIAPYTKLTGREPRRAYMTAQTSRDEGNQESGEFLKLTRAVLAFANESIPDAAGVRPASLSRIVRHALEDRYRVGSA